MEAKYVIGEHGDSEFVPWSNVNIALKHINYYLTEEEKHHIEDDVRNSAYEIRAVVLQRIGTRVKKSRVPSIIITLLIAYVNNE